MSKEVIAFVSETCAPCRQLKPEMEFQAEHRNFTLRMIEMSFENAPEFARYGVRIVPTVVCCDNDEEIGRFVGGMTTTAIEGKLGEWGL